MRYSPILLKLSRTTYTQVTLKQKKCDEIKKNDFREPFKHITKTILEILSQYSSTFKGKIF